MHTYLVVLLTGLTATTAQTATNYFNTLLKKAQAGYDATAMNDVARCYYNGDGTTKDVNEAVRWWLSKEDELSEEAIYLLGTCYLKGEGGVQESYKEAVRLWQIAARLGHERSQNVLKNFNEKW